MEDLATGVTPAPAMDITPAQDPFIQQLRDENTRLRERNEKLQRRMAIIRTAYRNIRMKLNQPPMGGRPSLNSLIAPKLTALGIDADQIIAQIEPQNFPKAAINWGDLGCRAIYMSVDDEGDTRYLIIVEEAAPGESEFCLYIANKLAELGWPNVEVITEW
jgi:hypothetical protein